MSAEFTVDRRRVLQAGGVVAVGVAVAACGSGESASPSSAPAESAASSAGSAGAAGAVVAAVAEVPVGGGVIIQEPPIVVTQASAGEIRAFTAICPHAGCLVSEVVDSEIICPCHGSAFSIVDGAVIQGPATQGLAPEAVSVQGDSVILG
jgi:Rieske Fe-S protein